MALLRPGVTPGSLQVTKAALLAAQKRYGTEHLPSVVVGYNAAYALYVHENLEMKWAGKKRTGKHPDGAKAKGRYWDPQGRAQSKFLEQPARENERQITAIVINTLQAGKTMLEGLFLGGLFLQRTSQKLVPVDTGNLKGSAFTEKE